MGPRAEARPSGVKASSGEWSAKSWGFTRAARRAPFLRSDAAVLATMSVRNFRTEARSPQTLGSPTMQSPSYVMGSPSLAWAFRSGETEEEARGGGTGEEAP